MNRNDITAMSKTADAAILVECIAEAARLHIAHGNKEAALRITRHTAVVLDVDAKVAKAWREEDWDYAAAMSASNALHAVRALARATSS